MIDRPFDDLAARSLAGDDVDAALLDAVVGHWCDTLVADERAVTIASGFGLSLPLATSLDVGLSDRSLGLLIPSRELKAGRQLRERLQTFGVLRVSGHEAFRGCAVVAIRQEHRVIALFARRLDDPLRVLWASGLPGGVFAKVLTPPRDETSAPRCLVTTSIPDALAIIGAMSSNETVGASLGAMTLLAPARPKGYAARDLKEIAAREDEVVVLGRGSDNLFDRLGALGVSVTHVASDLDVARTLNAASDATRVLLNWLGGSRTERTSSPPPAGYSSSTSTASDVRPETPPANDMVEPSDSASVTVASSTDRDETYLQIGTRRWRLRGARARGNVEGDRLNVALSIHDQASGRFHLDTLDLYGARQRANFLSTAASELHVERDALVADMVHVLHEAERARDEPRSDEAPLYEMSADEREEALTWLTSPDLLERLADDLSRLGVVGERTNLMVCYLAALSRKCERPFGVLVQSSSAGGKSTLVEAVTALVPPEDLVSLSSITSQALYYLGATGLRHKVLFVAEEHGSSRAAYALKLLVSEGRLSIASTGNDEGGLPRTKNYETAGPLSLMMTTTSTTLDPELENRLVVLGVDEDASQTSAIIRAQRTAASFAGLHSSSERATIRRRHHNVQRLLEPVVVIIPDGPISFPSSAARHRRDHVKFLSMITALATLHQYQRERRTVVLDGAAMSYIEATPEEVAYASKLCGEVLVRDLEGLAPQARRLLAEVRAFAAERALSFEEDIYEAEVTRRQLRERLGWSISQVRDATNRLVELEYLIVSGGGRGRCRSYRLVADLASTLHVPVSEVGGVGQVGEPVSPTFDASPLGKTDKLAGLVPSLQVQGATYSYPELSYTEMADRTPMLEKES
jgi:DNA primase